MKTLLTILICFALVPLHAQSGSLKNLNLVVFLSESCPMCRKYAPQLDSLYLEYKDKGLTITGLFPNFYVTDSVVQAFKEQYALHFPLALDVGGKLSLALNAKVTPQVFLMNGKGRVLYEGSIDNWFYLPGRRRTVTTQHYLTDAIENIYAGKPVTVKHTKAIGCLIVRN